MRKINWDNVHSIGHHSRCERRPLDTKGTPADMAAYVARDMFAWPGGYDLVLTTTDGAALCADCVQKNYELVYREAIQPGNGSGWKPAGVDAVGCGIDYDSDLYCDHCGKDISATDGGDNE